MEEIKLRRLSGQHLLEPVDSQTAVKDLCGLQAQFLSHALHGLSIRSEDPRTEGMVKSWTNRGTMHLISMDDLPLCLHQGRSHHLRPVDTLESDAYLDARRKAYFADLIVDAISQGIDQRDALKKLCEKAGMTEGEEKSLFDPWGGLIRALCESGKICHKIQEAKAYQLCPAFEPMPQAQAELELARRYLTHFGPATVRDAAYFFGTTQKKIKACLTELPVQETIWNGNTYFYIGREFSETAIPQCLFLAGFDQLMLGYEKTENLFLYKEHMREIFTLAGVVRPALLINGNVAGWWSRKGRKLTVSLFHDTDKDLIAQNAEDLWGKCPITFRKV